MKSLEIELEELETKRTRLLITILVGYFIWDSTRILDLFILKETFPSYLSALLGFGWLIFFVGLVKLLRMGSKIKKSKIAQQVLNDEWIESNRLKAFKTGYMAVLGVQLIIIILSTVSVEISGLLSAEISKFVAVISVLISFLLLNKSEPND